MQNEANEEPLKDPLAATIAAEVSADDKDSALPEQQGAADSPSQGSSDTPIQPQDAVNTGSQHLLKVASIVTTVSYCPTFC